LKHLSAYPGSELAAIVDCNPNPSSALNSKLLALSELGAKYGCPTFNSVEAMLEATQSSGSPLKLDG
jgi:hypothetical protein